jgi:ditrans,polycis-polyprenyl diphosphate synthase
MNFFERLACSVIKAGTIPRHVAFIMDGNRRYAQKAGLAKVEGHKQGFDTLAKVLDWCRELGINQVTLYAFSVENFKRTQDEIDSIMNLARKKCDSILDELDQVNEAGVKVRIAGDMDLLPQDLRDKINRIQELTKHNDRGCLNICLAYTSRHELLGTIKNLARRVQNNECRIEDVDLPLFEQNLHLPRPFPDLIIRTSGEVRLSDFMLWQCQESTLIFVDALWPEISIWDFLKGVFYFQYLRNKSQQ